MASSSRRMGLRAAIVVLVGFAIVGWAVETRADDGRGGPDRQYLALGDSVVFGFITQAGFEYINPANFVAASAPRRTHPTAHALTHLILRVRVDRACGLTALAGNSDKSCRPAISFASQSARRSATSRAVWNRSAGSLECNLATMRQSQSGTSGITS